VHCGFCTATCPTYVLLGDELDSPRGRIYLIKEMLEKDKPPTQEVVKHIDRLSLLPRLHDHLPVRVNYMAIWSIRRGSGSSRIIRAAARTRPAGDARASPATAGAVPVGMILARLARPFIALLPEPKAAAASPTLWRRLRAMLALAPGSLPAKGPAAAASSGARRPARPGRAAAGLRPAGAGAPHQPGRQSIC